MKKYSAFSSRERKIKVKKNMLAEIHGKNKCLTCIYKQLSPSVSFVFIQRMQRHSRQTRDFD